jgi:hypothetical protein
LGGYDHSVLSLDGFTAAENRSIQDKYQ